MAFQNYGYYAFSPYCLYPYASQLALYTTGIEVNLRSKITLSAGIECNHSRYNVGLFRVLWEIASDGTTANNYTASSNASVDKNVINLKSDIIEQYWQTTSSSNQWFTFDAGDGRTISMDTFALIEHNLTGSAVVKLKGYGGSNSSAPNDWDSVPVYTTIPMPADPLERNLIWIAQNYVTSSFRHWRVDIHDPTNPDGFIRIGRCVGGSAMIFTTENCLDRIDYRKENYKDEMKINGYTSIANNRALKKTMTLQFRNLNRLQYVNYRRLMSYITYCRDTLKALVIVDPSEPYQFSVFSKLRQMPSEQHTYISSDTSIVTLELQYDEGR